MVKMSCRSRSSGSSSVFKTLNSDAAGLQVIRESSSDRMSERMRAQAHVASHAVKTHPAVQFGHLKFKWPAAWSTEARTCTVMVQQLSAYQPDMGGARRGLKMQY